MKKIVLSIAAVMASAAFAPEASALPAFARQTGMACSACHFQKFPVLNSFGRAFKAAGYTMMGAQGKIEGEHLSIPDALNAAILAKVRYQKSNGPRTVQVAGITSNGTNDGMLQFGDEFSLFFGGRVAENIGFLFEGNTAAVGGALLAGFKLPVSFDVGGAKLSVVPFTTDALGAMYGYELSSGGVMRANRWAEHRTETSAVQYVNVAQATTGVTVAAQNDMGYITATKFAPAFAMGANGGGVPSYDMKNSYFRIAATPTVGDWSMIVGAGSFSGTSAIGLALGETRATFFDLQAHGELGGNEMGVYVQHGTAPASTLVTANMFNGGLNARKAMTIGVDYSVIPHALHVGAAYRNAKTGGAAGVDGDNAITLTAVYDLTQNVALHLNHSSYSGSFRGNAVGQNPITALTTFMLEAAW
ncbi:MAG: hypothetical protein A2342_09885 [Gallionellales bacterium RIFOXYB12_FULL_54_9]|nr:MAG: hypothetical protein A2342_09885 [Gallionellales bacterium RIFOXYB12_FULL_54_9]